MAINHHHTKSIVEPLTKDGILKGVRFVGKHHIHHGNILAWDVPVERVQHWEQDGYPDLNWDAYMDLTTSMVSIRIEEYITAEFTLGGDGIEFENPQTYGPDHDHSFVKGLPTEIVYDIIHSLLPKSIK